MRRELTCAAAVVLTVAVGLAMPASAENRVRLDSATTYPGHAVDMGIYVTNDVELQSFVVPLIVTTLSGGAFWTSADTLDWSIRSNPPGGATNFWSETLVDHISPDKVMASWLKGIFGPGMPPGTDEPSSPSIRLHITVNDSVGMIDIDSTFKAPSNTLAFVDMGGASVEPVEFIKSVITVLPCDCPDPGNVNIADGLEGWINVFDVVYLIDYVFRSGPAPPVDPDCPANRGDWNCDGVVNVLDVTTCIFYVLLPGLQEPPPCRACECETYPGVNCPR